jgi:nitrate reductase cytochrome c-type subunit
MSDTKIGMGNNFARNPRKIYQVVVVIWLMLFVTVMSGIVAVDLQRAEKKISDHANMHFQQANDRVHINESVLEGFAAMVSTTHHVDRAHIRSYAQKMIRQYPLSSCSRSWRRCLRIN